MKDLLIFFVVFYVLKIILRGAVSRHQTTDETAEKGGTTINALIVGTKKVDVHSAWTVRKTLHEGKSKEKGSASHDEEPSIDEFMN